MGLGGNPSSSVARAQVNGWICVGLAAAGSSS